MRKSYFGAASISALMLAVAACGDNDNTYQSSEADAIEDDGVVEETERSAAMAEDDSYADASDTQGAQSWDSENYENIQDRSPGDDMTATQTASAAPQGANAETSKTRSEIETLASEAFANADANDDGAIDRDEYVQLVLASARDFEGFVAEPARLMSVNPATDPEVQTQQSAQQPDMQDGDMAATEEATADEADAAAASTVQTAEAGETLDEEEAASIETAAAQNFQEAAGDDNEMTMEELRTAFLSRFDEADQDGDDELDAAELQTFAALTLGQETATSMEDDN